MTTTTFPIAENRLPNGLRLVVSEDHSSPVAAVNLWYNVGSRHEVPGRTGFAHLFEHLMFEGSRHLAPAEHFKAITAAGGTLNASTSTDRTNYFATVPADQLDVALWLEADRMGSLLEAVTQECLDKQRDVVRNERRQRVENSPYGTWHGNLCARLFPPGHPYAHPTIGSMEDLAAATLEDVHAFFRAHYAPNNAVLTVVGAVTTEQVLERVSHYFGGIPANDGVPPAPGADLEGPLPAEVRDTFVERAPDPAVFFGWRLPCEGDVRLAHMEVAVAALATGRGGAFHGRLVKGELAKRAGGSVDRRVVGASIATLQAVPAPGVALDKLEAALLQEVTRLAEDGPSDGELARAKAVIERGWLERVGDVDGRADEISRYATHLGEPELVNQRLVPIMETTGADVRDTVTRFLVDAPGVVLHYEPSVAEGGV